MTMLTEQETQALRYLANGFSKAAAAKAAGFKSPSVFDRQHVQEAMKEINDSSLMTVKVTRDHLTQMLFEAHRKSATATEEIAAIRELGKLHGLYEPEKVNHRVTNVHVIEEIEGMSTAELLELADMKIHTLTPSEYSVKDE
jgi:hypothetical protein